MTKKSITTETQALEAIGAKDFRSISKDQIISFVSSLPNMNKDVAIKCVEQFGNFKDFADTAIKQYYLICNDALNEKPDKAIDAHRKIIEILENKLNKTYFSKKEQHYLIEKIIDEGNKISELQRETFSFKKSIIDNAGKIAVILGSLAVGFLGGKIDLPFKKKP